MRNLIHHQYLCRINVSCFNKLYIINYNMENKHQQGNLPADPVLKQYIADQIMND